MNIKLQGLVSAFGTFLSCKAYMSLPKELEDAASWTAAACPEISGADDGRTDLLHAHDHSVHHLPEAVHRRHRHLRRKAVTYIQNQRKTLPSFAGLFFYGDQFDASPMGGTDPDWFTALKAARGSYPSSA